MLDKKDNQLQNTLSDLQKALSEWDAIIPDKVSEEEGDIRKKTQELLEKLNKQIKELGF